MKFIQYIEDLSDILDSGSIPLPFSEIEERTEEEVTLVLKSLCLFGETYFRELANFEPLESLFRKVYLGGKQNIFTEDEFFDIAQKKERLFDYKDNSFFVIDEKVSAEALDSIYEEWLSWIESAKSIHNETQLYIKDEMTSYQARDTLNCPCNICFGDHRAKIRDLAYQELVQIIDDEVTALIEVVAEQPIEKTALVYSGIKKRLDKTIYNLRRKLKPGTLRRLEKQVKDSIEDKMGAQSELAQIYWEKLRVKMNTMLSEAGMKPDLADEDEINRFFTQLGLGIWKFEKGIEKDIEKFITAVMAFKRKDISSTILKEYLGEFWLHSKARKMKRKIIYHMGPTNSGKTYHAINALAAAKTGCYLAPLRLLAGELYDTLNDRGVSTSLLTGEEIVETEGATHYSSTIEMAKLSDDFECCVIDEIQMITDPQRGWAWTRALIGMNAPHVHVCGDPSVLNLIKSILELTGDELEIIEYTRMTELLVEKKPLRLSDLQKNDALIVFSRKNALKYKADLESLGFKVSIVYGRLSPEVRREQARKFDEGETDIIVSTDAIAMGMNLPVQRIVFSTLAKFFNAKEYFLTNSEIKQIAGRAGRFQRFPKGYVNCLVKVEEGLERLQDALSADLEQAKLAMVGPDLDIFNQVNTALHGHKLSTLSLPEFLMLFNTMTFRRPFYCVDLKEMIEVAEMVESANEGLNSMSDAEIFGFSCAPVNLGQMEHVQYFKWMLNNYAHQIPIPNELIDTNSKSIDYLETAIKCVELFQWLSRHFAGRFFQANEEVLLENKGLAVDQLNLMLSEKIVRSCSSCGCNLPDKFDYNICEECFSQKRFRPRPNSGGGSYAREREKNPKSLSRSRSENNENRGSRTTFRSESSQERVGGSQPGMPRSSSGGRSFKKKKTGKSGGSGAASSAFVRGSAPKSKSSSKKRK